MISILVPSLGNEKNLNLFLSSLFTYPPPSDFEVCVHIFGEFHSLTKRNFPITITTDAISSMGHAFNKALSKSSGSWIAHFNDDMVFLENSWDELFDRVQEDRVLCWDLLEPIQGSFPPPALAGDSPDTFDWELANNAGRERKREPEPGRYFGTFILHRSLIEGLWWREDLGNYATSDIDMPYQIHLKHPQASFGRLGLCVYHFVHGSIRHHPELKTSGEEAQRLFVQAYGVTTGEAYERIEQRSSELWK